MYSKGKFHSKGKDYDALVNYTKSRTEVLLISKGTIVSAYKTDKTGNYSFASMAAQDLFKVVSKGLGYCNSKNGTPMPFVGLGAVTRHEFSKMKLHYDITEINHELVECDISNNETDDNGSSKMTLNLSHIDKAIIPNNIAYVKLTEVKDVKTVENAEEDLDNIVTRSIEEIALTKEDGGAWLKNKKYYIVNDDATAEQIFEYLDNYDGAIAYDTETTGLKINCFGKVGSHYEKELAEYNASHPDEKIREDRLVGIIFCVEPNVSYYFPVFNRKFKNLYQDLNSPIRKKTVEIIKARYTIGEFRDRDSDMANYIRNTPENEWRLDVILMERVRDILSKKHIVTHGGIFEWRVGWTYEIDTNICDDTMIIHQLIYKFRSTTSNAGEPSNLKYLAKHDLGVDQWELKDFFPNFKADDTGLVKERKDGKGPKKGSRIDFSYMDYAGTQIYAPADGDMTLELYLKYKKDMLEHFKDFEYIYNIEIIVTCAMGYVEFYGHRINESKINGARLQTAAEIVDVEEQIRQAINYASQDEINVHNQLKTAMTEAEKGDVNDPAISGKLDGLAKKLRETIDANTDHALNINSPAQVAALFFDVLGYPDPDGKRSVSKKVYKGLAKEVGDDGKLKYPIAGLYQKYKAKVTLQTKFFDQLQYFQYPEGLIFSDFGQISTATGRMSCKHPNCQQYPKVITKIVEPRPGYIMLDADYSQIEYRVLTALAHNSGLRELFSSPDSDYHTLMASLMYGVPYASVTPQMRSSAKSFNFGIPYGMGFKSLAILLHGNASPESVDDAKVKYEMYFKNQPNTRKFFDNVKEQAQVYGYTKTAFNRRRYYNFTSKDGTVNNAKKAAALRQAGNAVIQGCLSGETRIQTKELGIIKIKDAVNTHLHVWDGNTWAEGDVLYSGKKQKCIVTFSNGQKFICSPIHKFLVKSHKGNTRFVECKDLLTKANSKNPHRIVINPKYEKSDFVYSSNWARRYDEISNNANNAHLDDADNSFDAGVVLGRLASVGTIGKREEGASYILNSVAEHEKNIVPELRRCLSFYGDVKEHILNREGKNEAIDRMYIYSKSLVDEVSELDIKHHISDLIFQDTEMLRGFLRGIFDGDGGIMGKTITLTFGKQSDFTEYMRDIQKALAFFGIRSRIYEFKDCYHVTIKENDNNRFLDLIGFMNKDKQDKRDDIQPIRDEHIFGRILIPESVEITDEWIDMYDVCNTTNGYYVADGIVTHNTAADIFKISLARNFTFIRNHNLYGKLLIINLIHDEQLMEVDVQHLNAQRILAEVGRNMQFSLPEFPPLYIGAGIGKAWGTAKGKMAEIHPLLLEQYTKEAENIPIERAEATWNDPNKVIEYFDDRNLEFRRKKVADYITDPSHWNQPLHPAIGGLINLQFNYGRGGDAKAYVDENGNHVTDAEFLEMNLADFIKENGLNVDPHTFFEDKDQVQAETQDEEEDKEYDDDDDENPDDIATSISDDPDKVFSVVDESDKTFGSSLQDIISVFGCCLLENQRVCGIDLRGMSNKGRNSMIDAICEYVCEPTDSKGLQLVFLKDGNILDKTGVYVSGINGSTAEAEYKKFKALH